MIIKHTEIFFFPFLFQQNSTICYISNTSLISDLQYQLEIREYLLKPIFFYFLGKFMIAYNKDKEGLAYLESFMETDNTTCFSFWFSMDVSCSNVLFYCIY